MKTRMRFWFFKWCMGKLFTQQQNRVNVEVSEEYHSVTVFILMHDYFFILVLQFIQYLLTKSFKVRSPQRPHLFTELLLAMAEPVCSAFLVVKAVVLGLTRYAVDG